MMSGMAAAPLPALGGHRVILSLPAAPFDALVGAGEVLLQEGFRAWSIPSARLEELAPLRAVFGRRARIGVHDVHDGQRAAAAAAAGAVFLASSLVLPDVVASSSGVPVILGGLTPNELRAGMTAGAAAVQVIPCDAFGSSYARVLPPLLEETPVIASGRLEVYQAELWLEAGAAAVWPRGLVTTDLATGTELDALRRRCQEWRLEV